MPDDTSGHIDAPASPVCAELTYHPPYAWQTLRDFYAHRAIDGLEWVGADHYGRTIRWGKARGRFTAVHHPERHAFEVRLSYDDSQLLGPVMAIFAGCSISMPTRH